MTGFIKVKAKELLLKNTFKLFFVSFYSFVLKLLILISFFAVFYFSLTSKILLNMVNTYNSLLIYFIYSLIIVLILLLSLLLISGLSLGESAVYFMESRNIKSKFKFLFIFLRPSQSFRAFFLYLRLLILKSSWFTFFHLPPIFTLSITIFIYLRGAVFTAVFYSLIIGTVILFTISRYFYNIITIRYSFASFYLCTDLKISASEAIEKSCELSDGFLKDGVALKASFFPWILSMIFILPLFYVIPYLKLTKAKFVTFSDRLHYSVPQKNLYISKKMLSE